MGVGSGLEGQSHLANQRSAPVCSCSVAQSLIGRLFSNFSISSTSSLPIRSAPDSCVERSVFRVHARGWLARLQVKVKGIKEKWLFYLGIRGTNTVHNCGKVVGGKERKMFIFHTKTKLNKRYLHFFSHRCFSSAHTSESGH